LWCWSAARRGLDQSARSLAIEAPHSLSRDEARQRVQELLDYWCNRFGVQKRWSGDTALVHGQVMGVSIDAELVVGDHEVFATASDPGLLLRGAALDYVGRKLRKYLNPSYEDG
jgi:hypothetical protein